MLSRIIKLVMGFIGFITTFIAIKELFPEGVFGSTEQVKTTVTIGICAVIFFLFYFITGFITKYTPRLVDKIDSFIKSKTASMYEFILGIIGLLGGLIIASLVSLPIIRIAFIGIPVAVILNILMAYIGFVIMLRNKNDNIFVRMRERLEGPRESQVSCKLLDTNVIIDGRIYDICRCGFLEGSLIVPDFVIDELKMLSDSADSVKRAKGRRGLDLLAMIQKEFSDKLKIENYYKTVKDINGVDEKLIYIANKCSMAILTNDFNLNKVASLRNVKVLNINELSGALKPIAAVGEDISISIVKPGKEREQGIGYLDSGTMVVVEGTKNLLGETVNATVTSVIQTQAGRMIFANVKL